MPNKRRVQHLPSIIVEDFESKEFHLEFSSLPKKLNIIPTDLNDVATGIIPEVDGYVTPLSLRHTPPAIHTMFNDKVLIVTGGHSSEYSTYAESDASFTSVDIGCPNTSKPASSSDCSMFSSLSSESDATCFNVKSGILRVTQSIMGVGTGFQKDPNDDLRIPIPIPTTRAKSKDSLRNRITYAAGVFVIFLAFAGIVALSVAMYVEFVAKPSWTVHHAEPFYKPSSICDLVINGCDQKRNSFTEQLNHTGAPNDSGRTEGKFSQSFLNQFSGKTRVENS